MPYSVSLCSFGQHTPKIQLVADTFDENAAIDTVSQCPTTCRALEEALEDFLDKDESASPCLRYVARKDAGWLSCRKPYHRPHSSVLGILEELEDPTADVTIRLNCYRGRESIVASHDCDCPEPHDSWERTELHLPESTVESKRTQMSLDWIDIRDVTNSAQFLSTPSSCVHFLRSLLGCDHRASPWMARRGRKRKEDAVGTVMLVCRSEPPRVLIDFRVSDACPSWYLHGMGRINLPIRQSVWCKRTTNKAEMATLLIYRVLPPRDQMSVLHPITGVPATVGCLWEMATMHPATTDEMVPPEPFREIRMVSPPYIAASEYPADLLGPLLSEHSLQVLQIEAKAIAHWTAWPEAQHYQAKNDSPLAPWNVFPLCYCFPATNVQARQWIHQTCALVPLTVELLRRHLGDALRTALFSRLDSESVLEPHTGWEDLANHVYRVHIPLIVPDGDLCGAWVDGCVETHRRGRPLIFDDSKTHRAFNYSSQERIVLIIDLARPCTFPDGTARGGHSEELDKFIEQMGV